APPRPLAPTTVQLPGPSMGLAVGGGGRYVFFRIPTTQHVVIYDAVAGRTIGSIAGVEPGTGIAAGRDKVFFGRQRDARVVRFGIRTGQQEPLAATPSGVSFLNSLAIGSGSDGPLAVVRTFRARTEFLLLDPETFEELRYPVDDPVPSPTSQGIPYSPQM